MTVKIWKVNRKAKAEMVVSEDAALVSGDETHYIKVNARGTTIYGPVSIVAGTESIRTGGVFAQLPNLVKMTPSTMVSPIPDQIPVPPLHIAADLAKDVAYFLSILPGFLAGGK